MLNLKIDKKIIFVDWFDTVMFRHIHSWQLEENWAKQIANKFGIKEDIVKIRRSCINLLNRNEFVIEYKELIDKIYDQLSEKISVSKDAFYDTCYKTEIYADLATQYPNKEIVSWLKKQKESGKKIYIISDFYLPAEAYDIFLRYFDLSYLFDGIFCSVDYKSTKLEGSLYGKAMDFLQLDCSQIFMIGDSKISDCKNANKFGIEAYHYFPLAHKLKTNYSRVRNKNFSEYISSAIYKRSSVRSFFSEYSLNFFYFIKELNNALNRKSLDNVAFLSRGGYFLLKCFNSYQEMLPVANSAKATYFLNSRKVNKNALSNEKDRELLRKYMCQNGFTNKMCIVDEGWNASSQIDISELYDCDTQGYYIGLLSRKETNCRCDREGILFNLDEDGKESFLYGIFRSSLTFYEQICTAPHGSIVGYELSDNKIVAHMSSEKLESELYEKYTFGIQEKILTDFYCLCSWNPVLTKVQLAKYVIKTQLNGNLERVKILQYYEDHYFDNLKASDNKFFYNTKVNIPIQKLITSPENYMRYFCKVKLIKLRNKAVNVLYPVLGKIIEGYLLIVIHFKSKHNK